MRAILPVKYKLSLHYVQNCLLQKYTLTDHTCLLKRFLLSDVSLFFVQKNWVQPRFKYWEQKATQSTWQNGGKCARKKSRNTNKQAYSNNNAL